MNLPYKQNSHISVQLPPRSLQRVHRVMPGMTITCRKGILWLTQTGSIDDYTLMPGERMVVASRGDLLIEAMQESDLSIQYPN